VTASSAASATTACGLLQLRRGNDTVTLRNNEQDVRDTFVNCENVN